MKILIMLLLVIATAIAFPLLFQQDAGFVIISWQAWRLELSLATLILLLIIGGGLIWLGLKLLFWSLDLPYLIRVKTALRRQNKAHQGLGVGCFALLNRQWQEAETQAIKHAEYSVLPSLHYLIATYAAWQNAKPNQAMAYAAEAKYFAPDYEMTIDLLQIKLLQQQGKLVTALEQAKLMRKQYPQDQQILLVLSSLHLQLADWVAVQKLLPELRRVLAANTFAQLEIKINSYLD
jgi:HemY protein